MFRRRDGVAARCVHHDHPPLGGGFDVDIIHADSGAADDLEPHAGLQNRRGDLGLAAHDDGAEIRNQRDQFRFAAAGLHDRFERATGSEFVDATLRDRISDQDFHEGTVGRPLRLPSLIFPSAPWSKAERAQTLDTGWLLAGCHQPRLGLARFQAGIHLLHLRGERFEAGLLLAQPGL